ncbi:MAG: ribosome maturation factor RimP [Bacilli bacterium]|nr:ribosome maturation factor RimP [Bacilli bacterium]
MDLNKINELALKEAAKLDLEIVSVEYVKEAGENILRILIDKDDGVNINEATVLNQAISEALDELEIDEDNYLLEVSSVGAERPIKTEKDYQKAVDKYIYLEFSGRKLFGYLLENNDTTIVVEENIKGRMKKHTIEKNKINEIRLAIKF